MVKSSAWTQGRYTKISPLARLNPPWMRFKKIPHHLIGVKSLTEIVNAGEYAKMVLDTIDLIKKEIKDLLFVADLDSTFQLFQKVYSKVVFLI